MTTYVILALLIAVPVSLSMLRPRAAHTFLFLGGGALVYSGERLLFGDEGSWLHSLAGLLLVGASFFFRTKRMKEAGGTADAHQAALRFQAIGAASVLVYYLSLPWFTDLVGMGEPTIARWSVVIGALWPILLLSGTLPMLLLDRQVAHHPISSPAGAVQQTYATGLAIAFAFSLAFPLNYLANAHNVEADYSYFQVTRPGGATMALVRNLSEPVDVILFYAPSSDTKERMMSYFSELESASEGRIRVRVVDQAMDPVLAKDLGVRDNGYVVVRRDEANEKFKVDPDLKRARRDLKRLDGTFLKHLIKLAKGKRTAYMLTGHGEASPRSENPLRRLAEFKKLMQVQNYEVKDFGLEQGSAQAVPDDAAVVIIAAPERQLLDEEIAALKAYIDRGGALLVYGDVNSERMEPLLGYLGVELGEAPLAHATNHLPLSRGKADVINLYSRRFGNHASVSTLSKYATRAEVALLGAVAVRETGSAEAPGPAKFTPLIRSYEDTWEDANTNFLKDDGEKGAVHVLATAITGPESAPYRVIVVGDVQIASDFVLQRSQGSAQFALDGPRWLIGEEDLVGDVSSEEDVRIEHTRDEDVLWFYATIFGVPMLVLALGAALTGRRRRRR